MKRKLMKVSIAPIKDGTPGKKTGAANDVK